MLQDSLWSGSFYPTTLIGNRNHQPSFPLYFSDRTLCTEIYELLGWPPLWGSELLTRDIVLTQNTQHVGLNTSPLGLSLTHVMLPQQQPMARSIEEFFLCVFFATSFGVAFVLNDYAKPVSLKNTGLTS